MSDDEPLDRLPEPYLNKVRRPVLTRVFGSLLIWLLALSGITAAVIFWAFAAFTAQGPLPAPKIIEIAKGQDRTTIAVALQDAGVISDACVFSAAAAMQALRGAKLKAGEYEFPAGATMQDVLVIITSGRFLTYKVTIPEGWTTQMVVAKLQEQPELAGDVSTVPAEGSILPDTYVFRRGLTRQKLLQDMQAAETKLMDELWAKRPATTALKSKEELLTLASIVEKETGLAEERPQVASVFINRLKQGMKLQSDPTIIYGLVGGKGKLDRPLTKADIDAATPYNTYQISGLPPGPIANPGRAALEAVLNPAATSYLYFVADGTGGHAFATTLDEHNANVRKWRAQENTPDAPVAAEQTAPAANEVVPQPLPDVPTPETATPKKAAIKPPDKRPLVKKFVAEPVIPPEPTDVIPPEPTLDEPVVVAPKKPKK